MMTTTTVRFDPDAWAKLSLQSGRLRIAKAAFIRDATIVRLATIEAHDSMLREHVGDTLLLHTNRLDKIEQWIIRRGEHR